mgnify:CR=1 FL=1
MSVNKVFLLGVTTVSLSLGACGALPDWTKPKVLYGEAFSQAKEKADQGLKTDLPAISVAQVEGEAAKDTLDHVFEELGGDLANRNHESQTLRGGGSVDLRDNAEQVGDDTTKTVSPPPSQAEVEDNENETPKKSVFRGLSGEF